MPWHKRPIIYEINTWVWLAELRARYHRSLTLGDVPKAEWDELAALNVDAVWFMGVWQRSPAGVAVANDNAELQAEFHRALPDYTLADNVGSAYCIRDYVVASELGGPEGLARARQELARRGLRLLLDFVPNHVAPDHAWVKTHPEYFIRGTSQDLERAPQEFIAAGENVIANGRDPYFPPWRDVVQLNAFDPGLRAAAIETATSIASQCDGMRCDMAMLLLNDIFAKTWGERAGAKPETEYWRELIPAVKQKFPDVIFMAEAYWDLEYDLMQNGFDYCYDKRLYDRLKQEDAASVRGHLLAGLDYQDKLVRFIENHDEPRAAATFAPEQQRAAAVVITTVPGAKLIYDGQLSGRKIKLPVFLRRRAPEAKDYELDSFYHALLKHVHADLFHDGEWHMCECTGWSDNASFQNLLAWTWRKENERALIVINYSARRSQGMVQLPWDDLHGNIWRLSDSLNGDVFLRDGERLSASGLFVDLDAWRYHVLAFG
ncbi:MAG: alpha-amylase [Chloroflexota bacterium]|nr:MAG: alpha-amylase [Chloroflexota bacterium]